jgi:hypothetical protein
MHVSRVRLLRGFLPVLELAYPKRGKPTLEPDFGGKAYSRTRLDLNIFLQYNITQMDKEQLL